LSRLLLVRHGNTKLNSAERFWGQTDVELGADGIQQAEQLRDRLETYNIDTIYTSNLKRAVVTAEIIASRHQADIIICPELSEINFGSVEGLTFTEISQRYPELANSMSNWTVHPGFPNGESIADLNSRVRNFLPRLAQHKPEETILIVAHSGILRLLICNLLGIAIEYWRQIRCNLASFSIVDTYPQGAILTLLNEVSHLEP